MVILAIDPGPVESAYVVLDSVRAKLLDKGKVFNEDMLRKCVEAPTYVGFCVIEKIASYGMAVGESTFETVFWTGRFAQAFGGNGLEGVYRMERMKVKMHLCHSPNAKDGNIRQALIDRFGEPGTKKNPGWTYGIAGDIWSALAVSVTWVETEGKKVAA